MNLAFLSWRNIVHRPWNTMLNVLLFASGVLIITGVMLFKQQLQDQFKRNLAGIDMVVGAKGSPLQLILSSVYHADIPTGNISLRETEALITDHLSDSNIVEAAIPVSLGDAYKGHEIVGTTWEYIKLYGGGLIEGRRYEKPLEVVLGSEAAATLDLQIDDQFYSRHGNHDHAAVHDEHAYKVVGILDATQTILDQLILTDGRSIWDVHGHDATEEDTAAYFDPLLPKPPKKDKQITALLVKFRSSAAVLQMPRFITENTNFQAASPAIESARLFSLTGAGADGIQVLAIFIMILSGISVFLSLYSSMRDRRYEVALLRVGGASKFTIFSVVMLESLFTAWLGTAIGMVLGHGAMELLAGYLEESVQFRFTGWQWADGEWWLLLAATGLALVAAILPALSAMRTDISGILRGR